MSNTVRDMLAREAAEAKAAADAEERGERQPSAGQRARRQAAEASQVYSVRIPVERLAQLRRLADERGVAPTVLLRQFVLERLDQETAPVLAHVEARDVHELRLGPSRTAPVADVIPPNGR
jgi:chemotaxis protein histidine kinase CheA